MSVGASMSVVIREVWPRRSKARRTMASNPLRGSAGVPGVSLRVTSSPWWHRSRPERLNLQHPWNHNVAAPSKTATAVLRGVVGLPLPAAGVTDELPLMRVLP